MSAARRQAARKRARDTAAELIQDLLCSCECDQDTKRAALVIVSLGSSGLTVEQLTEFCDALDYDLVLSAVPQEVRA